MVLSDLNEGENSFRRLAENLPGIVYRVLIEDDNRTIFFNDMLQTMTGYSPEDLKKGKVNSIDPLILPDDRLNVINIIKDAIENNVPFEVEYRINNKSGELKWFFERGRPIRGYNGNPSYINGVIFDITARKKAEKYYRLISENANDMISILNDKYKYEYINEKPYLNNLGYNSDDLIGKLAWRFIHPDDICNFISILKDKERYDEIVLNFRIRDKTGDWIWIQSKGCIFKAENNDEKILLVSRDITTRKKAELKLKQSEEKYRKQNLFLNNVLESLTHPFYVINTKDFIVELANFTACSGGLEQGHYCYSLTHNRDTPCVAPCKCPLNEVKKTKRACVVEHIHCDKEGNEKTYEIYGYPILDESGNVVQMIEYALDISDRKKAEQKLIESEEKFRTIAERTLTGILILQDNQVKYVNDALLNMFEYSLKDIVNWEMDDLIKLIHPEDLQILREYRESLKSDETNLKPYHSYRVFTKSSKIKWIDQFSKEILYRGRPAELITTVDITEKKEVEYELIKLNNLKSELLRRTSHELRTPLVSIKGFSDLLLESHRDKLDDDLIRTIKQIRMGCNRLVFLVNDILKTAELESGTIELKKSKEDLSLLLKLCVSELEGLSESRNHTINLEITDNLICFFEKEQIYNVITNILSNAIKYTPPNGKIEVKSEIKNGFIIVSIKDNGIGFSKEERSLLFKQFGKIERYGQGYDVISEGSGLGLYISKKILEMHGGKIWLESEGRNKGSTFIISLPIDEK